jgi:molybdopterin-guanine dinucleotide biosynthesis protein A
MPFMTSEQMRFLCGLAIAGRGVVPVVNDRAEPLAAVYPREAVADFATALAGSNFSLQTLARNLARAGTIQTLNVEVEAQGFYRSVNEPADLVREG